MKTPVTVKTVKTVKTYSDSDSHLLSQPYKGVTVTVRQIKSLQLSLVAEAIRDGGSKRLKAIADQLHALCRQASELRETR